MKLSRKTLDPEIYLDTFLGKLAIREENPDTGKYLLH